MSKIASRPKLASLCFFLIISVLICAKATAQNQFSQFEFKEKVTYRIFLNDDSELIGQFVEKTSTTLVLKTMALPRIEIPFASIKKIEEVAPENIKEDGSYWFPNPNPTRYLFSPSAFNLKRKQGYYQNTFLFFNSFNVGATDFLTIGGGFELISTFAQGVTPILFFTPKVGAEVSDKVNVGGGLLFVTSDEISMGITYGIATFGNRDDNVTTGLGWGFLDGEFNNQPFITLSGVKRMERRLSVVSENWFIPDGDGYYPLFSYGIRFFGEKNAIDLAFINNADIAQGIVIGIPYVDFVVNF